MIDKNKFVAVIGGRQPSPREAKLAEEVGGELAKEGAILVCGGLGGIMEAACKGAQAEGGMTIGILPGESRQAANPYVQIPIATGIGWKLRHPLRDRSCVTKRHPSYRPEHLVIIQEW